MKILQIINNLGSGGAEKLISDFVPLMRDKGYETEVLLLQKKGSIYIDDLERKGIKVTCLSESSLYSISHIFNIRSFINKGKFDIVNVHIFPALYFTAFASILGLNKAKLIYTEHNTNNRRRESFLFKIIDKFVYSKYKRVIAITEEVKKQLDSQLNVSNNFSIVINNGVEVAKFRDAKPLNLSTIYESYNHSHKVICMIGRFSDAKDQNTLIEAVNKLSKHFHLLLIGEGPLKHEKELLVKKLNLSERVHFLGLRKDVPEILKACDIGVLSSHWEGFGLAAVEIMAAGKPVLVSNVEGLRDVIGDKELLFEKGNDIELSNKINYLLNNKKYYSEKVNYCTSRAKIFDINYMVDSYLKEYEKVLLS